MTNNYHLNENDKTMKTRPSICFYSDSVRFCLHTEKLRMRPFILKAGFGELDWLDRRNSIDHQRKYF